MDAVFCTMFNLHPDNLCSVPCSLFMRNLPYLLLNSVKREGGGTVGDTNMGPGLCAVTLFAN